MLKARTISRRALAWLAVIWLALTLAPLVALCFYAHPVYDDFSHIIAASETWAATGSVWQTLCAAFGRMAEMYRTWQGTWVAMLLSAFQPMAFTPKLFFITPLLTLAALCLSCAYFIRALMRALNADKPTAVIVYTVFLTYLVQFLPSIRETVYWQSGTPYTLSLVAMLLALGLLLKLRAPQGKAAYIWRCAALLACGAALGGLPYPLALGGAVGATVITAWCALKRSHATVGSLALFIGTAASLSAVVLAPGNGVRQEVVGAPMSAPTAIVQSLAECLQQSGQWVSPQLAALAIAVVALLYEPLRVSEVRFKHPLRFTFFSFGALAAAFVPPIYATGVEGYLVERVLTSLYMLFALLALANIIYWTGHTAQSRASAPSDVQHMPKKLILLCAALFMWGCFSAAIMVTPSVSAAKSLMTGEAKTYDAQMTQRAMRLAAAASDGEAAAGVEALSSVPPALPLDKLPTQVQTDLPGVMRRYYRLARLVEEYGAGHIPQGEWDALAKP